jgi:hypothetical protein
MTPINWVKHTIEYQEAVDLLLEHMNKTKKQNILVFPTIFLFRHYIELNLKEIILNNWAFLEISKPFPKGHSIKDLWKTCRDALQKTDKLVDPGFSSSQDYIKEIIPIYDTLESDLKKFATIDPDSLHSRYPVDTQGKPINVDEKLLAELLHELPDLVKRISYNLDGIGSGIYSILQDKYAGLSQHNE